MVTAFGTAFLMVSNITYRSHKSISLTRIKPFHLLAVLVVVMGLVAYQPSIVGFLCLLLLWVFMFAWLGCVGLGEALRRHCRGIAQASPRHCRGIAKASLRHRQGIAKALRTRCKGIEKALRRHC